jgi:hypothetical protein
MPVWRCPHCGTPQAETSRCWVCHRSTTSCGTCRHFRRGIAGGLGLCGLDPRRLALDGTEMRACWVARDTAAEVGALGTRDGAVDSRPGASTERRSADDPAPQRARTFVPVDELDRPRQPGEAPVASARPRPVTERPGWSLWGDTDP